MSKEKQASFVSYKKIMEESRVLRDDLIQSRIKQQQLKAENERKTEALHLILSECDSDACNRIENIAIEALNEGEQNATLDE